MRRLAGLAALVTLALTPAPAQATLGSLHGPGACNPRDAADDSLANGAQRPYTFCDDGVPPTGVGGIVPNLGAANAVPVPAKYQGFLGLPPRAPDAAAQPGADPGTGDVALDVNVALPPASMPGPHPVVFMHHGFTGSKRGWESTTVEAGFDAERWHDNNAWFASRGYVVVTYTMRGFTTTQTNTGSTGVSGPYSRDLEINDLQNLACKLAGDPFFGIDPSRVVVTGGSGGGGTSWLAITDPTWNCASEGAPARDMRIVAAAPKYGWTDLVESLVPNGAQLRDRLPAFDGSTVLSPLGYPKKVITAGFIARGNAGLDSPEKATLPPFVDEVVGCIYGPDPLESSPLCATTISTHGRGFVTERSAYYQNHFFDRIASDPAARVAIFSAGTFADPIFTQVEHDRFAQRLRTVVPGYPIQEYYGDYQHFAQNKAKEWGDLCGADRHVCRITDYPGGDLSAAPSGLVRQGVTSRLNRFLDHFARPAGNPAEPAPSFDTTADLLVCPENATPQTPKDEGGEQFTGASVAALAPNTLRIAAPGTQTTSSLAIPNGHALNDDPLVNSLRNGNRCPVDAAPGGAASAGPGVATYDSAPLPRAYTMIGRTRVTVPHRGTGASVQLNSRLYDLFPDGRQVMVDRSSRRLSSATGTTVFDLHGQGWRFPAGHRIRIELNQDDDPYIRRSSDPSGLTLAGVTLEVPVREGGEQFTGASVAALAPNTLRIT
ncbi:MAG: CocE/NonD family hydrolase, partial [Solirubrobacteraceae bacterium]